MAHCKAGLLFPSLKGLSGIQLGNVCSKWSRESILALLSIHHNQGLLNSTICKAPTAHHWK